MILSQLDVSGFRCLNDLSLTPHASLNLISGSNGSGKSSVLEAIQCLATGHTFRTRRPRELIAHDASGMLITATSHDKSSAREYRLGCERDRSGRIDIRLNFEDVQSQSKIARVLPVKSLSPESHQLIQDGPDERRRFLDWGLFHVKPQFLEAWTQYKRALSQRNQLLRERASTQEIATWNTPLLQAGDVLDQSRKEFAHDLNTALGLRWNVSHETFHVELKYRSGWAADHTLADALEKNLEHHRRLKTTTDGPHRAELTISCNDVPAKQLLSRGQQKALVYSLHLAQLDVLKTKGSETPIVLCDDLVSELDNDNTAYVIDQLQTLNSQIFVTGVDLSQLHDRSCAVFHMEHGKVINGL